ncbi:alkene reductase [Thalassotalea ponticola]|uniref:alkene reductase n=1 Tax=Thalassotalea ponticola TaxID=1523392 RepID=UPI0025B2EF9F|nr:alkene reductase [Thalassotalea ponticola]MDN3652892.1 alkene reductase [Thalassotalea ponticola]
MSHYPHLMQSLQLGDITAENRVLMAPLTRTRASGDIANELMAEHYAQRASSGLLIAEATAVMANCAAFLNGPGIYSPEHVDGWKKVTDAVHAKGGKIFLQIWHGGRACHPDLNNGVTPVAASPLAITNDEVHTSDGKKAYTVPNALTSDGIAEIVAGFKQGAVYAKQAGFDGVEVHAANGYLLDNFLRDGSNQRDDRYGGSVENRARLLFEVLDAVVDVWGAGRVGVRTSPLNSFNSMHDSDPIGLTKYLAERFNDYHLAYWHLMRSDFLQQQTGDVISPARALYRGNLIANMGYTADEAEEAIASGKVDAVAFGVPYIANPDLVERLASNTPLNSADPDTFYLGEAKGYTDYPFINQTVDQ